MKKFINENPLTISEIKILIPVLVTFATVVYGYAQLTTKVDYIIQSENERTQLIDNVESRLGAVELNMKEVQTELSYLK